MEMEHVEQEPGRHPYDTAHNEAGVLMKRLPPNALNHGITRRPMFVQDDAGSGEFRTSKRERSRKT